MLAPHLGVVVALGWVALGCDKAPPQASVPSVTSAPPITSTAPIASAPSAARTEPLPDAESAAPTASASAPTGFERRCGWVDNPTPANWWLVDREATWEIGIQGGHQADGDMPDFGKAWVETNGHYGYGCACVSMCADKATHEVLVVRDAKVLPLARCRSDKSLPRRP